MPSPGSSRKPYLPDAIRMTVGCDNAAIRAALARTSVAFEAKIAGTEDRAALELVLAEVLNNIVEHACHGIAGGPIDVSLEVEEQSVRCMVVDRGLPMPGLALPAGHLPEIEQLSPGELPEGGFGWLLIRSLTTDLSYRRVDGRNWLSFSVPTRGPAPIASNGNSG